MKGLINFFYNESPNVTDLKALNAEDIPMLSIYAREAYLIVSLLLISNRSIYKKLVEYMVNSYAMG